MSEFSLENGTPFALGATFVADEEGRPLLVAIVRATYELGSGTLRRAEEQPPPDPAGAWNGEPGASSLRFEPETAFMKPATDVVLVGHAHAPRAGTTEVEVELRVGPVGKTVKVFGTRLWARSMGMTSLTRPAPFERIPLVWERAFGGWDRSHADPTRHSFEGRNPVGVGFHAKGSAPLDQAPAPSLEDPAQPIRGWEDAPPPAAFGFVDPGWQPRAALAGTYDAAWESGRAPLLPADFDRRFFNAAAPGLVAPGYLRGDEPVLLRNASPEGTLSFSLPGAPAPRVRLEPRQGADVEVVAVLDTVVVDADARKVHLVWRGHAVAKDGPHGIRTLIADSAGVPV